MFFWTGMTIRDGDVGSLYRSGQLDNIRLLDLATRSSFPSTFWDSAGMPRRVADYPDAFSEPHGLAQLPEKLGRSGVAASRAWYARSSARHRVDHGTICGRSGANS
jgi:hypothetical protein